MARLVQIAEVCDEIFAGGDAPKGHLSNEPSDLYPIPVYSNGEENDGLYGYTDKARVTKPSVTVSARGTIGYTAIREKPFVPIVRLITLVPNTELINLRFLYYATQNYKFLGSGTSIPQLTVPMLKAYRFSLPDMGTQDKMVSILDNITAMISLRKKQLQKLDDLVKSRFVEMFGNVIRNNKGWTQYVFSDIAASRLGKMLDAKQQTGKYKYPYLANLNVQWFRFELENLNEMDFNEADQKEFELKDGDLLVCEGGEIGRCAVWHNEVQPCYFQKALHRVRCNTDIVLPEYLARWFQYNCEHGGFASIEGAKATIAHLPGAKLKSLTIAVPPIELQQDFVMFAKQADKSKLIIQQGLDKLEQMKQALMQKYFG